MDVYVLDASFKRIAVIDKYESLIWTTRARAVGDFALYLRASEEAYNKIYSGAYLVRETDVLGPLLFRNVMRLNGKGGGVEIKEEAGSGIYMNVTGQDLKSILYQRVISEQTALYDTIPNLVTELIDQTLANPADGNRAVNIGRSADDITDADILTTAVARQWTGTNLGDAVQELLDSVNLSYDITVANGAFYLKLYEGIDRSYEQNANDYVIFSAGFENLISTDFRRGKMNDYCNGAYIGGEGEGSDRTIVEYFSEAGTGLDRYEAWVDARNTSSNNGEITQSEYEKGLKQEGAEAVAEARDKSADTFDAEIDLTASQFKLNTDFYLNDIVQVKGGWISAARRVVEVIESEDKGGRKTVAKFA